VSSDNPRHWIVRIFCVFDDHKWQCREFTDTGSAHVGELYTCSSAGADEFIGAAGGIER
jgi:predicted RNA-binding protein with PIN domain